MIPHILIRRRPGGSKWGRTRGPVIVVPHDAPPHQLAHEKRHVAQWWLITTASALALAGLAYVVPAVSYWICALSIGVMGALMLVSRAVRFHLEADAYAVSARIAPDELDRFARALANSYGTGRSEQECMAAIVMRM